MSKGSEEALARRYLGNRIVVMILVLFDVNSGLSPMSSGQVYIFPAVDYLLRYVANEHLSGLHL
jgi:hypothetical protein